MMASRIKAIKANRPQIELAPTVRMALLIEHIAGRTGLNTGEVLLMAYELRDALTLFLGMGQPVQMDGVGTFTPDVHPDGELYVHFRPCVELKRALNTPHAFTGRLRNPKNFGKTSRELVAQWNAEHPDDPVEE
jgi:hypothetical protein